jgi:hypothetical protein
MPIRDLSRLIRMIGVLVMLLGALHQAELSAEEALRSIDVREADGSAAAVVVPDVPLVHRAASI